jgi:hypothetical protein
MFEVRPQTEMPAGKRLAVVLSDVHVGNNSPTCWYQKAMHEGPHESSGPRASTETTATVTSWLSGPEGASAATVREWSKACRHRSPEDLVLVEDGYPNVDGCERCLHRAPVALKNTS